MHNKSSLESRHGITRSILLKLKAAYSVFKQELLAIRAAEISNDLYGNDAMSLFELAKESMKPVIDGSVKIIPDGGIDVQERLQE